MKRPSARGATRVAPADVLADRGREALRAGRFKEAVEVFKLLVQQDKCQVRSCGRLCRSRRGSGR